MADLTVTAAQLRIMESIEARLIPMIADTAITKGQAVYRKSTGRAGLAKADDVATAKVVGIATTDAAAGTAFEALYHGRMVGFGLGSVNPGVTLYLSKDNAGGIVATAPSADTQVAFPLGTVHTMTDGVGTKFVFFDIPQNAEPVAITS